MRFQTPLLLFALGLPVAAGAQRSTDTLDLTGRSTIMVGFGLIGARDASATFNQVTTHTDGEVASIAFSHWIAHDVAITVASSVVNANETVVGAESQSNAIVPLLFGVSYSPRVLAVGASLRPYVTAAAGPYFHMVADAGPTNVSSSTESAAGARLAAGTNWFVARHFALSLEGEYYAVGQFDIKDAASRKPSGFGMTFGLGFAWGGR